MLLSANQITRTSHMNSHMVVQRRRWRDMTLWFPASYCEPGFITSNLLTFSSISPLSTILFHFGSPLSPSSPFPYYAGPGATLSQQKVESVKDSSTLSKQKVESVKDNSTLSQQKVESEKDSSTLSQQKVESEKASSTQVCRSQQMKWNKFTTWPLFFPTCRCPYVSLYM